MGRKSTKENKSIYQIRREEAGLTREQASEMMDYISADRIYKIENNADGLLAQPEDILAMATCYKDPGLINYYCSHECPIGQKQVPEIKFKELSQIAIETLNSLNRMNRVKDRLLEIVEDGDITPDEYKDFTDIKQTLDRIRISVDTLQLWIDKTVAEGKLDSSIFEK